MRSGLQWERDNSQRDIDFAPRFGIECRLQCPIPTVQAIFSPLSGPSPAGATMFHGLVLSLTGRS